MFKLTIEINVMLTITTPMLLLDVMLTHTTVAVSNAKLNVNAFLFFYVSTTAPSLPFSVFRFITVTFGFFGLTFIEKPELASFHPATAKTERNPNERCGK